MSKNVMVTNSGKVIDYENLTPEMFDHNDIGHALAHQCRYAGHIGEHYSVAQHLCLAADYCKWVSPQQQYDALMHDAAEAYVTDIPRALKRCSYLKDYAMLEDLVQGFLATKYNFTADKNQIVQMVDTKLACTEIRDLLPKAIAIFAADYASIVPFPEKVWPWPAGYAKEQWFKRFHGLRREIGLSDLEAFETTCWEGSVE